MSRTEIALSETAIRTLRTEILSPLCSFGGVVRRTALFLSKMCVSQINRPSGLGCFQAKLFARTEVLQQVLASPRGAFCSAGGSIIPSYTRTLEARKARVHEIQQR